jgi:hypothetical protein
MADIQDILNNGSDVQIIEPDYRLKEKIGNVDVKQIFTDEVIKKAQGKIENSRDNFLGWVAEDIEKLEKLYNAAIADLESCKLHIVELEKIADKIKAQAGTFGFNLATSVAKSLCNFCNKHKVIKNTHLIVIRKHIDTLSVIFKNKIEGDGGVVGTALHDGLKKLVEKYS